MNSHPEKCALLSLLFLWGKITWTDKSTRRNQTSAHFGPALLGSLNRIALKRVIGTIGEKPEPALVHTVKEIECGT